MNYGLREICNVVLKAKGTQTLGKRKFYKDEPVLYFDSLKTSSMEGAATTVYANGGRGNSRLVAWEGERTVTWTMEDALLSPESFAMLSGAEFTSGNVKQHINEIISKQTGSGDLAVGHFKYATNVLTGKLSNAIDNDDYFYAMIMKDGEIVSEPYICKKASGTGASEGEFTIQSIDGGYTVSDEGALAAAEYLMVDYYREVEGDLLEITPEKFAGNYYLEGDTLFRDTQGQDWPAEIVIPNCKIQSNFTLSMAATGDPSTFTFTMDAFPDYTHFNQTKKVLAALQIIHDGESGGEAKREQTIAFGA